MQNIQSIQQPRIEDSILFDVNQQTLIEMNLTQHICRLDQMSRFLTDALLKNRANLYDLRQVVKGQINQLKSSSQMVQNYVKDEADRLKTLFEPAIGAQVRKINEMKLEVSKITSEQLTTKKIILNLQASISHCETQIGFMEFHK